MHRSQKWLQKQHYWRYIYIAAAAPATTTIINTAPTPNQSTYRVLGIQTGYIVFLGKSVGIYYILRVYQVILFWLAGYFVSNYPSIIYNNKNINLHSWNTKPLPIYYSFSFLSLTTKHIQDGHSLLPNGLYSAPSRPLPPPPCRISSRVVVGDDNHSTWIAF